jgi:hypothetical protein
MAVKVTFLRDAKAGNAAAGKTTAAN